MTAPASPELNCDTCGREGERLRGGQCERCVVTGDLEQILKPHTPPDLRVKRLVTELAAVPRPESIITWMHPRRDRTPVQEPVPHRTHTTPLASSRQRLELIKTFVDAEHTHLSTRIAALVLLFYSIPVRRIRELILDDVETTAEQTTLRIGTLPAPIPEPHSPTSTSTSPTAVATKR